MIRILAFLALLALSSAGYGAERIRHLGNWYCEDCSFPAIGTATNAVPIAEAVTFIKSVVNQSVTQWRPGDVVFVCDGTACVPFVYNNMGSWYPGTAPMVDTGVYRNKKPGAGTGAYWDRTQTAPEPNTSTTNPAALVPAGYFNAAAYPPTPTYYVVGGTGHWEWWDYYANGTYAGSSEPTFTVDSVSISPIYGAPIVVIGSGGCVMTCRER